MKQRDDLLKLQKNAAKAAGLMKTLAHPERLMILCQLVDNEYCVGELLNKSPLSSSAFSQHLSVLRRQGLVTTRKEAQSVFYSLADKQALEILKVLHKLYCQ